MRTATENETVRSRLSVTPDELFVGRFERLQRLNQEPGSALNALDISAILRLFFIDGDRLVDLVNRSRRLKLRFRVPDASSTKTLFAQLQRNHPELGEEAVLHALWYGEFQGWHERFVSHSKFASAPILYLEGKWYTLRDVVKFCAVRLGGVHIGEAATDDAEDAKLRALDDLLRLDDIPPLLRSTLLFGKLAVEGLMPLYERVRIDAALSMADESTKRT